MTRQPIFVYCQGRLAEVNMTLDGPVCSRCQKPVKVAW